MMYLNDFKVPGKNLIVRGSMEMRSEDIAGETSSSEVAEKGIKPKILRVNLSIPFKDETSLTNLVKVAEAKTEEGEQQIYTLVDRTANAVGVRQCRFIESINFDEMDDLQMWQVSFALQEHMSNPERVEQRSETGTTGTAASADHTKLLEEVEKQKL